MPSIHWSLSTASIVLPSVRRLFVIFILEDIVGGSSDTGNRLVRSLFFDGEPAVLVAAFSEPQLHLIRRKA